MKAVIDTDRCRGHGICWSICPEVFDLTDDGYAEVLTPEVPTEYEAQVREATSSCPERAITVN
ncbi:MULTISPECIES: ferredoxin [unclassified Streptomyces]|uniref:ferredoxin n=1 Tax=unclassified Streptomyces TaxID=2593676 RepID=UPI00190BBD12|nr:MULTISPECIES: ferredoxin [unclassified Streptomyces]MBK3565104.1 ferredoxin [Streptomyces sp. MBT62]MBK6009672.1 ferredoxin [Streptomyces sp. MBT53]